MHSYRMDAVEAQAMDEILGGCPLLDADLIESAADRLWPHHEGDIDRLFAFLGLRHKRTRDLPSGVEGLTLGGLVLVRDRVDESRVRVTGVHECGHVVLDQEHPHHTHPDVWCFSIAALAPRVLLASMGDLVTIEGLARRAQIPLWVAIARLRMGAIKKIVMVAA